MPHQSLLSAGKVDRNVGEGITVSYELEELDSKENIVNFATQPLMLQFKIGEFYMSINRGEEALMKQTSRNSWLN